MFGGFGPPGNDQARLVQGSYSFAVTVSNLCIGVNAGAPLGINPGLRNSRGELHRACYAWIISKSKL